MGRRFTQQDQTDLVALIHRSQPHLLEEDIEGVLGSIAPTVKARASILAYMKTRPDALVSGDPHASPQFQDLITRLISDGSTTARMPLCQACRLEKRIVHTLEDGRRICRTCVSRSRLGVCRSCGARRQIRVSRNPEFSGICTGCYRKIRFPGTYVCPTCGMERQRTSDSPNPRSCLQCHHNLEQHCVSCGETRPIASTICGGRYCSKCYLSVVRNSRTCPQCLHPKILAYTGASGEAVCASCAGVPPKFNCRKCSSEIDLTGSLCGQCALADRLASMFQSALAAGEHSEIADFAERLSHLDHPRSILRWVLRKEPNALLTMLASRQLSISHMDFDKLPQTRSVQHLRALMVEMGLLQERDARIERFVLWAEEKIGTISSHEAYVLRQYTKWKIERSLRYRYRTAYASEAAATVARTQLTSICSFIKRLNEDGLNLRNLKQQHVNAYLVEHTSHAHHIGPFLRWTWSQQITGDIEVPEYTPSRALKTFTLSEHRNWVHKFSFDETVATRDKVVGLLVLLVGIPVSRIATIRRSQISVNQLGVWIRIGSAPFQLPQPLAKLIQEQCDAATLGASSAKWLFPSRRDSHMTAESLVRSLNRYEFSARQACNSARFIISRELPPKVMSDLTGVGIVAATMWSQESSRDWIQYPALRNGALLE